MRIFIVCFILTTTWAWAQSKVAQVKMLRGEASIKDGGKLAQDQWVSSGVVIVTQEKSFVRLMFIDKSQMNIGPNSEMKIEQFGGGDAGVIDLVRGKIRSQVSKDYLQQKDKDKSKMFIKTPNAVMGIRGTDFLISTNGVNTSAVLFEGEVVFEKLAPNNARGSNTDRLEAMVDRGVRIMPGEFSVVEVGRANPTVPSLLNVQQVETLEKNQEFSESAASETAKNSNSAVPAGLSGATVANNSSVLNKELEQTGVKSVEDTVVKQTAETAKGFSREGELKPTSGSILHVDSGVIIAPPKDAIFDANSGTYIVPASGGVVDSSGNFQAPAGMAITGGGEVFAKVNDQIIKLDSLSAVIGEGSTFADVAVVVAPLQSEVTQGSSPAATDGGKTGATTTNAKLSPEQANVLANASSEGSASLGITSGQAANSNESSTTATQSVEAPNSTAIGGGVTPGTLDQVGAANGTRVNVDTTVNDP